MKMSHAATTAALLLAMSGCMAGGPSASSAIVADDFESTAVGAIPAGFTKTGELGVEEGVAHSGKHALMIQPGVRGGRSIDLAPDKVAALGGEHWGRLYIKFKTPAPKPTGNLIHATIVHGRAVSPSAKDTVDTRLATFLYYPTGLYKYMYNVQPPNGRREFGPSSATQQQFDDAWHLLEWHVANATQTYQFFVDGKEVTDIGQSKGAGNYDGIEIPEAFQTLQIGFTNYQAATDAGFTVYIDDIAVGKTRQGAVRGAAK